MFGKVTENYRNRQMTNNQKLKIIQRHFKLKGEKVIEICLSDSIYTVYSWRSSPSTNRYRAMPSAKYKLLVLWLIDKGLVASEEELNTILEEA